MKHEFKRMDADNGDYAVRHSRLSLVIAAVVCLLLAIFVWLLVMNAGDTKTVPLVLVGGDAEYTYTLSDAELELSGAVFALKAVEKVEVEIPKDVATVPGTHAIALEDLVLPEGISLAKLTGINLTVAKK